MEKYKIKNFSQHIGFSLDTIKHYQQCGIISPEVDPINNYRYYTVRHGERLIVSRRFRNLGFSLDDTKELVSSKNGTEIKSMLSSRKDSIQQEISQLQNKIANIEYYQNLCDLFLQEPNTFHPCMRPEYHFYRHTQEMSFTLTGQKEDLVKEMMNELPNTCKLMIISCSSIKQQLHQKFSHTIAIQDHFRDQVPNIDLSLLNFLPSVPAVKYIYSRPYTTQKDAIFYDIIQQLIQSGCDIDDTEILAENAIDFYQDGIRYENYILYFPLRTKNSLA